MTALLEICSLLIDICPIVYQKAESNANLFEKVEEKWFISVGGGAMLKFLETRTLPIVDALK